MSQDRPSFSDLEPLVCDAANFATALRMAVEGINQLAIEDEDQIRGLEGLASEAMYAALKARALWYELHEHMSTERRLEK